MKNLHLRSIALTRQSLRTRSVPTVATPRFVSTSPSQELPTSPSTRYKLPTHTLPTGAQSTATAQTLARSAEYLLPVYARPDFVLSHGKGSYVWDTDGRKYLDFSAGIAVNALGHADEGVVQCMTEQAGKLLHTSNVYHHEWAGKLAELLVTLTQTEGGLGYATGMSPPQGSGGAKVFFSNSGTEANEGALKVARKVGKERWAAAGGAGQTWDSDACSKTRIVCFEGGFHGRSMGALSVTTNPKYQAPFAPLLPGVDVGRLNDMEGLGSLVNEDTCAVIVEPIQGEGGLNAAKEEWLRALRKRCDEVGAVLIFDEIQCGLYRTGRMWAHSGLPVDCHPDIVTMAKPLANGYPVGAVLIRDRVAETMTPGTHGTTFGGSPVACAVGHHVLTRLASRTSVAQISETSKYLMARLERLPGWFPDVLQSNIRGRGMMLGLGFKKGEDPGRVMKLARERGVFVLTAGKDAVRLVPSLNVGKEEVDMAVDVLESSLGEL